MLDAIYDREKFPTKDEAIDWLWCSSKEELEALDFVLFKFFQEVDGVFIQQRIKDELDTYAEKCKKNQQIAIDRETRRKEKSTKRAKKSTERAQVVHEAPPNQEPRTKNQEPITINQLYTAALPCKDGEYFISDELINNYIATYKKINVIKEIDNARTWLLSNPSKQKTKRGCSRFINGWLSRAKPEAPGEKTHEKDFIDLHTDTSWSDGL